MNKSHRKTNKIMNLLIRYYKLIQIYNYKKRFQLLNKNRLNN